MVTASATFHGHELKDIPVINPGGWWGKTWLIEIGGSYWPLFLVVEADTVQDAIDELAYNEKYRHHIVVPEADLDDYPEESRHYGPSGQVIDLDHLMIHGMERVKLPFPCRYHGEGLPAEGICPTRFEEESDDDVADTEEININQEEQA
jgi:hypothetical protein